MKKTTLLLVLLLAVAVGGYPQAWAQTPVVVELFTAEGCSSCPPADALLGELGHRSPSGVDLILMGEHVDYWNHLGWTDRFSSADFSQRQNRYDTRFGLATVFTPQMVIDGHLQLGNAGIVPVIAEAAQKPKPAQVALQWEARDRLHITVHGPAAEHGDILLAITEDGLSTKVGGGENSGKTLHHAAVVRELRVLGNTTNGQFDGTTSLSANSDWNRAKLKAIVLLQQPDGGAILGAAEKPFQP